MRLLRRCNRKNVSEAYTIRVNPLERDEKLIHMEETSKTLVDDPKPLCEGYGKNLETK
jgi:hypothetical protein